MQSKAADIQNRNYESYFPMGPKQKPNQAQNLFDIESEDEEEINIVKEDETAQLRYTLPLPSNFVPRDFDYYELDEELVIIGICGGSDVIFAWLNKPKQACLTAGHQHTFKFGNNKDYKEELVVIKAGIMYYDKQQIMMQEVFVAAGKSGFIHVFKLNPESKTLIEYSSYQANYNRINDLCFGPTHNIEFRNLVVSCSDDGTAVISNIECMQPIAVLLLKKMPVDNILAVDWREGSEEIVTAHLDGIRIWQLTSENIKKMSVLSKEVKKGSGKSFDRVQICDVKVKIPIFHNFYVDFVKALPNGTIITKSVDGCVYVWTYEISGIKNEPMIIKLNQYKTVASMDLNWDQKYVYIKGSVNPLDNLFVIPSEQPSRVSIFHLRNKDVIFKKLYLETKTDLKIIKAAILDDNLSYALILTANNRLWFHKLKDINLDPEK